VGGSALPPRLTFEASPSYLIFSMPGKKGADVCGGSEGAEEGRVEDAGALRALRGDQKVSIALKKALHAPGVSTDLRRHAADAGRNTLREHF
jgi:hypothetical protein